MQLSATDVVLVTGGGQGLGEATVRSVVNLGAKAVIVDLPDSRGADLAAELSDQVRFAAADVRDGDQIQQAVGLAAEWGTLRAAVTCAGVVNPGRLIGKRGVLSLDAFRMVIEINLIGTFNVLRLAANVMVNNEPADGDRGVIVMTSSAAAFDGQIGQAAYAASKGGIVSLTLTAARDLADKAIRVMTIAPGTMETPMMAGLPGDTRQVLESQIPHPSRMGRPAEFGMLVDHIIANPLLNGEVIRLDGALRMPPR